MLTTTPHSARRGVTAAIVAVLASTLAACNDVSNPPPDVTDTTVADTTATTVADITATTVTDVTDPAADDETVVVVFDGLTGAKGRTIVGVLNPPPSTVLGGFRVNVDTDPFSARQSVFAPDSDDWRSLAPVTDVVALVSPGTYQMSVFLLDREGNDSGYGQWVPSAQPGLAFCKTMVDVRPVVGGEVRITGVIPPGDDQGMVDPSAECTTSDH